MVRRTPCAAPSGEGAFLVSSRRRLGASPSNDAVESGFEVAARVSMRCNSSQIDFIFATASRFLMSGVAWDDQRIFLAVLQTGSLSAAARALGLTQPTVRARLEALE